MISRTVAEATVHLDRWDEWLMTHRPVPDPVVPKKVQPSELCGPGVMWQPLKVKKPVNGMLRFFQVCLLVSFVLVALGYVNFDNPGPWHGVFWVGAFTFVVEVPLAIVAKIGEKHPEVPLVLGAVAAADIARRTYVHHEQRQAQRIGQAVVDAQQQAASRDRNQPRYGGQG